MFLQQECFSKMVTVGMPKSNQKACDDFLDGKIQGKEGEEAWPSPGWHRPRSSDSRWTLW